MIYSFHILFDKAILMIHFLRAVGDCLGIEFGMDQLNAQCQFLYRHCVYLLPLQLCTAGKKEIVQDGEEKSYGSATQISWFQFVSNYFQGSLYMYQESSGLIISKNSLQFSSTHANIIMLQPSKFYSEDHDNSSTSCRKRIKAKTLSISR